MISAWTSSAFKAPAFSHGNWMSRRTRDLMLSATHKLLGRSPCLRSLQFGLTMRHMDIQPEQHLETLFMQNA
jgi:hypothetical protein